MFIFIVKILTTDERITEHLRAPLYDNFLCNGQSFTDSSTYLRNIIQNTFSFYGRRLLILNQIFKFVTI